MKVIIGEARRITISDSLEYIYHIFLQISSFTFKMTDESLRDAGVLGLADHKIFPVWTGRSHAGFDCLKAGGRLTERAEWYVAHNQTSMKKFEGQAPLLAFHQHRVWKIFWLLHKAGFLLDRYIKNLAVPKPLGGAKGDDQREEQAISLGDKWKHIVK